MNDYTVMIAVFSCLFGSGGIVLWGLNRIAKIKDDRNLSRKDVEEMKRTLSQLREALVLALENDKVIFTALKTHRINGESEGQERKMDRFFLSLMKKGGGK